GRRSRVLVLRAPVHSRRRGGAAGRPISLDPGGDVSGIRARRPVLTARRRSRRGARRRRLPRPPPLPPRTGRAPPRAPPRPAARVHLSHAVREVRPLRPAPPTARPRPRRPPEDALR